MAAQLTHLQRVRMLYKSILRMHRGLPETLRLIGDSYVKEEFRKHKKANELQAVIFMQEWTKYYVTVANQIRKTSFKPLGQNLTEQSINDFNNEQILQLHELYTELNKDIEPMPDGKKSEDLSL